MLREPSPTAPLAPLGFLQRQMDGFSVSIQQVCIIKSQEIPFGCCSQHVYIKQWKQASIRLMSVDIDVEDADVQEEHEWLSMYVHDEVKHNR